MWPLSFYVNNGYQIVPLRHSLLSHYTRYKTVFCVLTDKAESPTISIAVAAALQDLPDQVLKSIEDTLKTLGAVTANDLQHIKE